MRPGDKYLKIVEYSEEDGCYVGTCPELMLGGIHGRDQLRVYAELCSAIDDWVRIQKEDGEPLPPPQAKRRYSGRFVLRVGKDLHRKLAIEALRAGKSLNAFCEDRLRNAGQARRRRRQG